MDIVKTAVAGIVAVGLVAAVGLHATQLGSLTKTGFSSLASGIKTVQ